MFDPRRPYPSDLPDAEWALLAQLLPPPARCGRPRKWPANEQRGWRLEVVHHPERYLWRYGLEERPKHTFRVLPRRWAGAAWAGERTCACLGQSRRLSKDYERLPSTSEAMIYGAMSRLMLRRLARAAAVSQHPGSVGDW